MTTPEDPSRVVNIVQACVEGGIGVQIAQAEQVNVVINVVMDHAASLGRSMGLNAQLLEDLNAQERGLASALAQVDPQSDRGRGLALAHQSVRSRRLEIVEKTCDENSTFALRLGAFLGEVRVLAESPNPALQAGLELYASGLRARAFETLYQTIQASLPPQSGEWSALAALAGDMRDRGEKGVDDVIRIWERAMELDPSNCWGWYRLGYLYLDAARVAEAVQAFRTGQETAPDERGRMTNLVGLGDAALQLGNQDEAIQALEEARDIARWRVAQLQASAVAARDLALCLEKLGDATIDTNRFESARAAYAEGRGIVGRLLERNPTSDALREDHLIFQEKLGDLSLQQGALSDAQAIYQQNLTTAQAWGKTQPTSIPAARQLASARSKLGDVVAEMGQLADARAHYAEAISIQRHILARDPASSVALRDLAYAVHKLSEFLVDVGDADAASAGCSEFLRIARSLHARTGGGADERTVAMGLNLKARLAMISGDAQAAVLASREAVETIQRLLERSPQCNATRRELAISLQRLGDAALLADDLREARASLEASKAQILQVVANDPGRLDTLRDLAIASNKIGNVALVGGELQLAAAAYTEGLNTALEILARSPKSVDAMHGVYVPLFQLGEVALELGKPERAEESFRQCIALAQSRAGLMPGNPTPLAELARCLNRVGRCAAMRRERQAARVAFGEAERIFLALLAAEPGDEELRSELAQTRWERTQITS